MIYDTVIVGGGPAAAIEANAMAKRPGRHVIAAPATGGNMVILGRLRLQSYADELYIGDARSALRRRLRSGAISPTGTQYTEYVSATMKASGIPLITAAVADVQPKNGCVRVELEDGEELTARHVVVATGVVAKRCDLPSTAMPVYSSFEAFEQLRMGRGRPFRQRSVVIVGSGNSAMQLAAILSAIARDVTILARKYTGVYPQETSDRFAWRAQSQLTCELIAKYSLRCRANGGAAAPCVRYIVYDELDSTPGADLVAVYRAARNYTVIGCCSLPDKHPHSAGRIRSIGAGAWCETFSTASTVVVAAVGVTPAYPAGRCFAGLPRDSGGYLVPEALRHVMPGVMLAGACAGCRSVNEMKPCAR